MERPGGIYFLMDKSTPTLGLWTERSAIFNFVSGPEDDEVRERLDKGSYWQLRYSVWREGFPHWFSNGMEIVSGKRVLDFGACEGMIPYCTERFKTQYEAEGWTGIQFQPIICPEVPEPLYLLSFSLVDVLFDEDGLPLPEITPDFYVGIPLECCCKPEIRRKLIRAKLTLKWYTIAEGQSYGRIAIHHRPKEANGDGES